MRSASLPLGAAACIACIAGVSELDDVKSKISKLEETLKDLKIDHPAYATLQQNLAELRKKEDLLVEKAQGRQHQV